MQATIPNGLRREMTSWRRELHRHPEFGFEQTRTASFVASKLREFGIEVVEGIGGTGVVGTLTRGRGTRSIALRADMDALRIEERSDLPYRSKTSGTMHACGHDGHMAMLLGAAKVLANEGGFDGTVRFLFQPAEECGQGAAAMLNDGLMERFPFSEIYGLHNMPGYPVGEFRTRAGPLMSAEDIFEIELSGIGGHAARPHVGSETLVAACSLVMNLQTIVSRRLDPTDVAVVSVTQLVTDGTRNVLPGEARILGDARSFRPEVSAEIERQMQAIVTATAAAYGVRSLMTYTREFVPLVNDAAMTGEAFAAAEEVFAPSMIKSAGEPMTASEDFARLLERVPGCFAFVGNGERSAPLHNASYDFDDEGLPYGAAFHVAIVRRRLRPAARLLGDKVLARAMSGRPPPSMPTS